MDLFLLHHLEREETTADGNDKTCEKSRMHEAELKYSDAQK